MHVIICAADNSKNTCMAAGLDDTHMGPGLYKRKYQYPHIKV